MASHTRLLFRDEARGKLLAGASALADAVRVTLGPRSKCVVLEKKWGSPQICDDGVTIAKRIALQDPDENLGAQMLKEAASRTGDAVGDGTTTSTLLAHAMFAEGLRNVAAGASAIALKRGIDRGVKAAVDALRALSRPVASRTEKAQIAAVSAHGNEWVGDLVADAVEKVGTEGTVSVEEAKGTETSLEFVEGMQFDRGLAEELGLKLESVSLSDLGRAKRVVVDKDSTTIIGGAGSSEAIAGRCAELRRQIDDTTSDYDKEKLQERLAKLAGGVAVIHVGAPSEAEMKNRKDAFEDAIASTRAAVTEGIVPGGGVALLRCAPALERELEKLEGDERTGLRILRDSLEIPIRQIALNSGVDAGVVADRVRNGKGSFGFDARRLLYLDLTEAGIIDPTRVVRTALENAASVAGTLLLAEATLTDIEKKTTPTPAGALPEF